MKIAIHFSHPKWLLTATTIILAISLAKAEPRVISLADVLRLADEANADLALQIEDAKQAAIETQQAWLNWLPTLRYGTSYVHQDGLLQETSGNLIDVERNGRFDGFGVGGVGAGLAGRPGLSLEVNLADAIFDPSAERQRQTAAEAQTNSTRLQVMKRVAVAYYELAHNQNAVALAQQAVAQAEELAKVTSDYAEAGEGLAADAERAAVEALLRQQRLEQARYSLESASAQLANLLQVDESLRAAPDALMPIELPELNQSMESLLALAEDRRPELQAAQAKRKAAAADQRKNALGPLIPRVGASYSDTDFGGGLGSNDNLDGSREETAVAIYWQLDQLGLGALNKNRIAQSKLRQIEVLQRQAKVAIATEVSRAYAQWQASQRQLALAQEMVERARKSFELDRARIYERQALPLETLFSQQTLAEAELAYIETVARYNTAQLALAASIGQSVGEN